jgi:enterochelin esterase family protein
MVLETNRHMRVVLLAKGYEVHYQQFVGGHDYLSWRGTLADGSSPSSAIEHEGVRPGDSRN